MVLNGDVLTDFDISSIVRFHKEKNALVTLTLGDASWYHERMGIHLEGALVGEVSTATGEFVTRSYTVTVSDGQLTLRLQDLGGPGIYFVLDHEAPAGTDLAAIARLHRIEKAQVIREVTAAGFTLQAEGSFLRRPGDDHTLPIFDKAVQGHTDQYALHFVKPRG